MSRKNHRQSRRALEIDVLKTPRGTRVISNTPLGMARDVHSDLSRAATSEGAHAFTTALGLALKSVEGEDQ